MFAAVECTRRHNLILRPTAQPLTHPTVSTMTSLYSPRLTPAIEIKDWSVVDVCTEDCRRKKTGGWVTVYHIEITSDRRTWMISHRYRVFYDLRRALLDLRSFKSCPESRGIYRALKQLKFPSRTSSWSQSRAVRASHRSLVLEGFLQQLLLLLASFRLQVERGLICPTRWALVSEFQALVDEFLQPSIKNHCFDNLMNHRVERERLDHRCSLPQMDTNLNSGLHAQLMSMMANPHSNLNLNPATPQRRTSDDRESVDEECYFMPLAQGDGSSPARFRWSSPYILHSPFSTSSSASTASLASPSPF